MESSLLVAETTGRSARDRPGRAEVRRRLARRTRHAASHWATRKRPVVRENSPRPNQPPRSAGTAASPSTAQSARTTLPVTFLRGRWALRRGPLGSVYTRRSSSETSKGGTVARTPAPVRHAARAHGDLRWKIARRIDSHPEPPIVRGAGARGAGATLSRRTAGSGTTSGRAGTARRTRAGGPTLGCVNSRTASSHSFWTARPYARRRRPEALRAANDP
jgi:hypothetical protein